MPFSLSEYFRTKAALVDDALLTRWIPAASRDPATLHEAMRYSVTAGGKRVRPVLVFAAAQALGMTDRDVLPIAAALEMIHVFSLIHDDLPAMDDDDLRRGKPTNHKVFGEAMAILAGDALNTHAFVALSELDTQKFDAEAVIAVMRLVAEATGCAGMIGGQVIDIQSEGQKIDFERLKTLHRLKTGALIRASVVAPAVLIRAAAPEREALTSFGEAIGLCFQIADDILDIEGGVEIGKDIGSDVEKGKATYPSILGMEGAKSELQKQLDLALAALKDFDAGADPLREIARFIAERKS